MLLLINKKLRISISNSSNIRFPSNTYHKSPLTVVCEGNFSLLTRK